jgi:hypothetical protein
VVPLLHLFAQRELCNERFLDADAGYLRESDAVYALAAPQVRAASQLDALRDALGEARAHEVLEGYLVQLPSSLAARRRR